MNAIEVDTTRLPLSPHDLRLPAIARIWPDFAERADKEGWRVGHGLNHVAGGLVFPNAEIPVIAHPG